MTPPVIFAAIDPGINAAIAIFQLGTSWTPASPPTFVQVKHLTKMCVKGRERINGGDLRAKLNFFSVRSILIESVHAFPHDGVASAFKFGFNTGIAWGVADALNIPIVGVEPATWKRALGLIGKKKNQSIEVVNDTYRGRPDGKGDLLPDKMSHHEADAICIGIAGRHLALQAMTDGIDPGPPAEVESATTEGA